MRRLLTLPLLGLGLSACAVLPGADRLAQPNPNAVENREVSGDATTITYNTALMNRAEAERFAQLECEGRDQTLNSVTHPPATTDQYTIMTFTCRRPFS